MCCPMVEPTFVSRVMGGRLSADSAGWGTGATFTLELPLRSDGTREAVPANPQASTASEPETRA